MKLYRLWSEWDLGHENLVFTSIEDAKIWADRVNEYNGVYEEGNTIESVWDDLQGVYPLKVIDLRDLV